jgi:hypothetical protein
VSTRGNSTQSSSLSIAHHKIRRFGAVEILLASLTETTDRLKFEAVERPNRIA